MQISPLPFMGLMLGALVVSGDAVLAQYPNQIDVVVQPVQTALYGADALETGVMDAPATSFDFRGETMKIVEQLDNSGNWVASSLHEKEFIEASERTSKAKRIATQLLRDDDTTDAAMLLDFLFFVSTDHQQVRLVARLRTYTVRHGRHYAIEKLTRRYEFLSPVIDPRSGYDTALSLAITSIGRMMRADLKLLMTETRNNGERRSFYGLDPGGKKITFRGRVLYFDDKNTVYVDADGNLYSVPTAT